MIIKVEHASKRIRNKLILEDISMELKSGRIYGFQGINGCGKTMLMRLISGLMQTTRGKVLVNGKQVGKEIDFPERMGLLLENPAFLEQYTGLQNLRLLSGINGYIGEEKLCESLRRVGLKPEDKRKYKIFIGYEAEAWNSRCHHGRTRASDSG